MAGKDMEIKEILDNSDKAELLERVAEALETEGSKVVVILGIPDAETDILEMAILQRGHHYSYELTGFIAANLGGLQACIDEETQGDEE